MSILHLLTSELDIDVKTSQEIEHIKNVILEHFPEKYFSKTNLIGVLSITRRVF